MKTRIARATLAIASLLCANLGFANPDAGEPASTVVCSVKIIDAQTGLEAVICRQVGGNGGDGDVDRDVGSIGVVLRDVGSIGVVL